MNIRKVLLPDFMYIYIYTHICMFIITLYTTLCHRTTVTGLLLMWAYEVDYTDRLLNVPYQCP